MTRPWHQHYPKGVSDQIDVPEDMTIASLLQSVCHKHSDKLAITCMGSSLTFREFERLAEKFASYLQHEVGLTQGDRIAIMLPNIMQFPIAFYGAQKIGVTCVNTNPQYTAREMRHQFADSGAKAVVILDLFAHLLDEVIADTNIEHVIVTRVADQLPTLKGALISGMIRVTGKLKPYRTDAVEFKRALQLGAMHTVAYPKLVASDVAVIQYTGGTTGSPKGAMLTQGNILANIHQIQTWAHAMDISAQDTVLTALPLYHIFALSVNFLAFLSLGGEIILVPKPIPIKNTVKMFKKYPISVMTGVNTLFNAMNNDPEFQSLAPKSIKIALAGGMALQESVGRAWSHITGNMIVEGFGMTESSPVTHCNPVGVEPRLGSIGVPLPSTDAQIVGEDGEVVPVGEVGELVVRGPQIMKGYWRKDIETARVIKKGWLHTGDIARMDADGYFYIVDRKKDMILVSGFNVYPNEIEEVLAAHPKILEAAVIGVPDAKSGEAVKAVVVKKDTSLTEAEIQAFCAEQLTNYKRPKLIEFREELPKTNIGKILRRELRDEVPELKRSA